MLLSTTRVRNVRGPEVAKHVRSAEARKVVDGKVTSLMGRRLRDLSEIAGGRRNRSELRVHQFCVHQGFKRALRTPGS